MSEKRLAAEKAWKTRRKKARKLSKAARKAWETRLSDWEELRDSILLVECIPEEDIDCSEAKNARTAVSYN